MAIASGKLNGTSSSAKYQSVFLEFWQISQSIENNQTTFGYKAYMQSNVSGANGYTGYGHYTFTGANPIAKVSNQTWSWTYTTAQLIKEGTFTKTHAADGTLASQTLTVTAGGSTALGYATVSISLPVATIPRATQPTVNYSSRDMGLAISIGVSGVATFTHKLYYTFTGIAKTLITTVAAGVTSYAWTIPLATLAPKIPNSTSGTVTITAETLSGSTVIGSKTVTFTATVPDTVVPSISSTTATEAVSGLAAQFGAFIQGKSKLNLAMTATAPYGATISSYSITGNGQTFSAASGTTGFLSTAGPNTITYQVTDSRGRSTSATLNITVLAYAPPQIHTFRVERVNASGVVDPTGDRVKATYKITVASLGSKNIKTYTLKYKRTDVATWTSVVLSAASYVPDTSYTATSISTSINYDFEIVATDYFGSTTVSGKVSSGFVPAHFRAGGKGLGIGMRATKDALQVGMPAEFGSSVSVGAGGNVAPYGAIYHAPSGVLIDICPDTANNMVLVEVIGHSYGTAGPISTLFQVYHYTPYGTFLAAKQKNMGSALSAGKFLLDGGRLKLWFPQSADYQTYIVRAYTMGGVSANPVVTNAAEPASSYKITCTIT